MAKNKEKDVYDEWSEAYHSKKPGKYLNWLKKEERFRGSQALWKKIKTFVVIGLVNILLAAPIGFITFYAVSHTLAQTPFGVKYKGDPDLYHPYDARELVPGEITALEKSTIGAYAPVYGAGLAMIVAAFLSLMVFLRPEDDDDEIMALGSLVLSSLCASFAASIGSMIIMDPFYVQEGINANWVQPLFEMFFLAIVFAALATLLGVIFHVATHVIKGKLSDLRDLGFGYKEKIAEYFAR